ncbi:MAG: hypothetical protein Q8861_06420 [Bacteroidota bacterium]|nr:hypothetical protein [Bacteroidota bacterium]
MRKVIAVIFICVIFSHVHSQTKIGGIIGPSDANAYLELGDAVNGKKGLLLPRINLNLTTSPAPLTSHVKGMLVYNKTTNGNNLPYVSEGIYYNDGTQWIKIIDISSTSSLTNANNGLSKSGANIVQLGGSLIKPTTITASSVNTISLSGLQTGLKSDSLIVSDSSGVLRKISFNELIQNLNATNGLSYDPSTHTISFGGTLTRPTTINTDATNTLSITGLQTGNDTDNILVADPSTGVVKSVSASSLASGRKVVVHTAIQGQIAFSTPYPISSADKIQVYRNGTEINFSATAGSSSITLKPDAVFDSGCFAGDEIKIYQWK